MIEILREMILGVTAAAIFSSVMLQFAQKSALQEIVRLATGMLLILALLTPLSRVSLPSFSGWIAQMRGSVAGETQQAQVRNEEITRSSVAGAVSKYLGEQAQEMGMQCTVRTTLAADADGTMRISSVTIQGGQPTAAQRSEFSALITKNCGVSEEQISFAEE